jgi:ABC-type transport system substrate-binding protein
LKGQQSLEVRLTTFADSRSIAEEVALRITGYWDKVGVRASVQNLTWSEYAEKVFREGSFDAAYGGWSFALMPDPSNAFHSKGSGNFISYSNPGADARLDSIASLGWNPDRSLPLYHRVHRLIAEDAPCAFLFSIPRYALLSNSIYYGPYVESFKFFRRINKWTVQQ